MPRPPDSPPRPIIIPPADPPEPRPGRPIIEPPPEPGDRPPLPIIDPPTPAEAPPKHVDAPALAFNARKRSYGPLTPTGLCLIWLAVAPVLFATEPAAGQPTPKPEPLPGVELRSDRPSPSRTVLLERADEDMRNVLQKLETLGAQPLGTISVDEARRQPTPADAVQQVMRERELNPGQAQAAVATRDARYPTHGHEEVARIYMPPGPPPREGYPVIVYYHGGGWVMGSIDTYQASAMALAEKVNAIVVSAAYRQAPEHKFPAAHDDALAAYKWVMSHIESFGGDPRRLAVSGESAGGNLAINVAIAARDQGLMAPRAMLLIYPVAGTDLSTPSYLENAEATPLNRSGMEWFFTTATRSGEDLDDPRLNLVKRADLRGLPRSVIITAEIDPLRSEGEALARRLEEEGGRVRLLNTRGVSHEFFGMAPVVEKAKGAQAAAAFELRSALEAEKYNAAVP